MASSHFLTCTFIKHDGFKNKLTSQYIVKLQKKSPAAIILPPTEDEHNFRYLKVMINTFFDIGMFPGYKICFCQPG